MYFLFWHYAKGVYILEAKQHQGVLGRLCSGSVDHTLTRGSYLMHCVDWCISYQYIKARLVSVCAQCAVNTYSPHLRSRGSLVQPRFGVAAPHGIRFCFTFLRSLSTHSLSLSLKLTNKSIFLSFSAAALSHDELPIWLVNPDQSDKGRAILIYLME